MSVIYLTKKTSKLSKNGGRLVVRDNDEVMVSLPAINVTNVVVSSEAQISTQAIRLLLAQGSHIVYTDWQGNFIGMTTAERGDIHNAFLQMGICNDEAKKIHMVKFMVITKLNNQVDLLKTYAKYRGSLTLQKSAKRLSRYALKIEKAESVEELRGIEGACAKEYFSMFDEIVCPAGFNWNGRSRRPAADEVNAMLNYGYAFLEREVRVILMGAGLDERFGFLHANNGRKDSLVYDLMELVRQSVIDRLVLHSLCRKRIKKDDFEAFNNSYRLTDEGRGKWIDIYEQWMQEGRHGRRTIKNAVDSFVRSMRDCDEGELCAI